MKPNFFLVAWMLSLGTGFATTVSGDDLSIGTSNYVTAGSMGGAFGDNNTVVDSGLAVGHLVSVQGYASIGSGTQLTLDASSPYSGLFGSTSTLTASSETFVFGGTNVATNQQRSFLAGFTNKMLAPIGGYGQGNIVLGQFNSINPDPGTAAPETQSVVLIGSGNTSSQSASFAIGIGNIGQNYTVTLGAFNQTVSNASLIVGTGTDGSTRSNGLVVLRNGTVNIPSGNLVLGSESALTASSVGSYLSANNYLRKVTGSGASAASGAYFALGEGAEANDDYAIAMGRGTLASNEDAIAMGAGARASGDKAQSIGPWSAADGELSTAIGSCAWAFPAAKESIAIGAFANVQSMSGLALGYSASVLENSYVSTAIGYGTTAAAHASTAVGTRARTNAFGAVALGTMNLGLGGNYWSEVEPAFELGNGYTWGDVRSNAITTLKNGQTKLTNKFWSYSEPKDIPSNATEASNGEALVVEGHSVMKGNTRLKGDTVLEGDTELQGKVTLAQPQGDISMGVYGD